MTAPYKIRLFDDCCHVFASDDAGATWQQNETPSGTLGDEWSDMYMAINDGDYSTLALFDEAVNAANDSSRFDNDRGGVEITTFDEANTTTIGSYSYGTFGTNWQQALSGAITANGQTVLIPTWQIDTEASNYPRLSTDGGSSFSDVTGLTAGRHWTRACFSQNAAVMYIHGFDDSAGTAGKIYKSTDGGSTWSQLSDAPTFSPSVGQSIPGHAANSLRMRCSQNGIVVAAIDWFGNFWISTDGGTTWTETSFSSKLDTTTSHISTGDFGLSLDGSVLVVGVSSDVSGSFRGYVYLSTDFGSTWQLLNPPSQSTKNVQNLNVSTDGVAIVVVYANGTVDALVDVSVDQGITWDTRTFAMTNPAGAGAPGNFVSAYIVPSQQSASTVPAGDPNLRPLVGATYRRVSAFATESPSFVGWHRHDFGHGRNQLMSIGVSSDVGGLLDHLDMVTTDGTNYYVEGFTQLFDEDDALTDAWFLDGALVPDSAYADTVGGVDGLRFTGLWYLRTKTVTMCAFGLDLGDFTVDVNGTAFVPYGSGTAPSSFDYTAAGAGAYLFTAAYITANLLTTAPRNGGVPYSGGFIPAVVGFTYTSDGQILRPIAADQTGTRAGPSFGEKRRNHYVKALLKNTIGIMFGTDFGATLQMAKLSDDAGTQNTPTEMYSGLWRETVNDDYSFDGMLSWRVVRPYPASVVSVGGSIEGIDA